MVYIRFANYTSKLILVKSLQVYIPKSSTILKLKHANTRLFRFVPENAAYLIELPPEKKHHFLYKKTENNEFAVYRKELL